MDPFRDRVAVVTGGASGIGAALARAFARRGSRIVLADIDREALPAMEEELRGLGADVLSVEVDVRSREQVAALADTVFDRFGAAHLLCNNAGIATSGRILDAPLRDWEDTMAVDFWGVVHGVRAFVPRMVAQGDGGAIVNTASMAGLVGMEWLGIYCAAKFAVVGLSESLHRELRPRGIGVSVLCPMIVSTNLGTTSQRFRPDAGRADATAASAPPEGALAGSVKEASEVAERVVHAVERRQLYVLTHEEQREILRRRAARLDACFEPERWNL